MVSTAEKTNIGYITQVIGPVVDVKFPPGKIPEIYNALTIAGKNEAVFILKNEQLIICSAKLKSIEQELLLTGVACDPIYQSQGYASLLINKLLVTKNRTVYCFPYLHLKEFYLRLGFVFLALENAPEAIQRRFKRYQQHRALLLMVYK